MSTLVDHLMDMLGTEEGKKNTDHLILGWLSAVSLQFSLPDDMMLEVERLPADDYKTVDAIEEMKSMVKDPSKIVIIEA